MKYNILENNRFYIYKGIYKISYKKLYSYLEIMKNTKRETMKIDFENEEESKKCDLKLYQNDSENGFEFKIDSDLKKKIYKKKRISFYNKNKILIEKINIYNNAQIYKYHHSLVKEYKNINFYDLSENMIKYNDIDLFEKIAYFQQISNLNEKEEVNKENYYKKIYNIYFKEKFENEGQQLSFNLLEYSDQNPKTFEYHETSERDKMFDILSEFTESKKKILAITGVSGIGKTITLLQFLKLINTNNPNCYFNVKKLSRRANVEKLASEFVKLFIYENSYNDYLILVNEIEKNSHISLWEKIKLILDYISKKNDLNNEIIIVIDQYKIELDLHLNLFHILKSENYSSHFKFIICSSVNEKDIKSNISFSSIFKKLSLKSMLFYQFFKELFSVKHIIQNDEIKTLMEKFNYIPKYYYLFINNYHEDTKKIKDNNIFQKAKSNFICDIFDDIKTKLVCFYQQNGINLIANYNNICNILQGEPIAEYHLINTLQIIPLKYCSFYLKNNKAFFEASFDFFYRPFRTLYKEMETIDFIDINHISKNRGELGNVFDSLVNSHFDVNKNVFGFDISHVIIVNEIIEFSYFHSIIHDDKDYFKNELNIKKIFDKKVIYLEQRNSNGQCVDGALLIPNENSNTYSILFYQSSIKKRKHFSKEFIYNGIYLTTKKNINTMFGIVITNCYFMYIIDQNDRETISYCKKTAIYYIFYEFSNRKFLYSNYKDINKLEQKTLQLLEIQKPNLELIHICNKLEESNDISEIKKNLLNRKRYNKTDEEENEDEEEDEKTEGKEELKNKIKKITNKGYTIPKTEFCKISEIYGTEDSKGKNDDSGTKNKTRNEIEIPTKWKNIFNNYNFYRLIKEDLNASNAIFELPVFYMSEEKYIIIKKNDDYHFYYKNNGEKLKQLESQDVYDSFNPFYKGKKRKYLDVYLLINEKTI